MVKSGHYLQIIKCELQLNSGEQAEGDRVHELQPCFPLYCKQPLEALNRLALKAFYLTLQRDSQTRLGLMLQAMLTYLGK